MKRESSIFAVKTAGYEKDIGIEMNIKCIALDLDRTTLNEKGGLSEGNRAALRQAMDRGLHIVVASGRSFHTLPQEIRSFAGIEYAVTGNGAATYHMPTEKCLHKHLLTEEDVRSIMKKTENDIVTYETFIDGVAYAGKEYVDNPELFNASPEAIQYMKSTRHLKEDIISFIMENKDKLDSIDVIVRNEREKRDIWKRIERCTSQVYITSSVSQLVEISHKNAGKHMGVAYVANLLGLQREEVAAFGDAENDVDMLRYVGYGIAMENASRECKAAADYVTKHHNEDGVAYGMRKILKVIE